MSKQNSENRGNSENPFTTCKGTNQALMTTEQSWEILATVTILLASLLYTDIFSCACTQDFHMHQFSLPETTGKPVVNLYVLLICVFMTDARNSTYQKCCIPTVVSTIQMACPKSIQNKHLLMSSAVWKGWESMHILPDAVYHGMLSISPPQYGEDIYDVPWHHWPYFRQTWAEPTWQLLLISSGSPCRLDTAILISPCCCNWSAGMFYST